MSLTSKKRLQTLAGLLKENFSIPVGVISSVPAVGLDNPFITGEDNYNNLAYLDNRFNNHHDDPSILFKENEDELGMVKADVSIMLKHLENLQHMLNRLEEHDHDINFPHWWQAKIVLAKEYISKADDYLSQELEVY